MFALAAWTVAILLLMVSLRVASKVKPSDFAMGESDRVPLRPRLAHRNYVNLLELPVLFYVVGMLGYVSGASLATLVPLAWTYVGLRVLHSLIHIGYNNVAHRALVFAASNIVLVVMWVFAWQALDRA